MADVGKFFGSLFGSAAGAANPATPVAGILDGAEKIIGMFKLSPEVKAQLQAQLIAQNIDMEKAELAANLAQIQGQLEINKEEAQSTNMFIAGWRPAVGWVCVLALFYAYIFQPFAQFSLAAFHINLQGPLPTLDTGTLISGLLIPLLGLAGLRTYEKVTGTEGNR
jgi:hypothetical protein